MKSKQTIAIGAMLALGLAGFAAAAEPAGVDKWDMATLERLVQPMKHELRGRMPLLPWNFPLPRGEKLVTMRADGSLRKAIDALAARGIVPTVELSWEWTPAGALALARTIQEAGQPVIVMGGSGIVGDEAGLYATSPKFKGPSPLDKDGKLTWKGEQDWPCLPIYDIGKSVAFHREWAKTYKEAGLDVKAAFVDHEGLPHPWNFVYESQKQPDCAKHYPPGALDNWQTFASYANELRAKIIKEAVADPVHEFFPKALVGNYADSTSTAASPFIGELGNVTPPVATGDLVDMPAAYATPMSMARYYNKDWPVTQEGADRVYFTIMLRTFSTSLANKAPGKLNIPYINRFMLCSDDARYNLGIGQGPYREVLRHTWLRGADGFYMFNLGYPGSGVTPAQSLESVEDARSVMDEMLEHREFLERGKPMNFDLPDMLTNGIVWSGLALPDQVLVRTFTFSPAVKTLDLVPFPGVFVKLAVTNRGATYLIDRKGQIKQVQTGLL